MGEKIVVERIYTDKNPQEAMGGGSKGGRCGNINRDAVLWGATQ